MIMLLKHSRGTSWCNVKFKNCFKFETKKHFGNFDSTLLIKPVLHQRDLSKLYSSSQNDRGLGFHSIGDKQLSRSSDRRIRPTWKQERKSRPRGRCLGLLDSWMNMLENIMKFCSGWNDTFFSSFPAGKLVFRPWMTVEIVKTVVIPNDTLAGLEVGSIWKIHNSYW